MRLVYLGTPEIAVPPLLALHAAGHEIVLVVTGADKRRGRGRSLSPTPVKTAASDLGLTVTHEIGAISQVSAELGVVVAFGSIIGTHLLEHLPMVNLHFSLLPRWRGAAPVERAILAGDSITGVTLMAIDEGLDTGAVLGTVEVPIDDSTTSDRLKSRLAGLGAELLVSSLATGLGDPVAQSEEGATYADKIRSADRELGPRMSVDEFLRTVRVGGAWTTFRGRRLKVLEAHRSASSSHGNTSRVEPGQFVADTTVVLRDGAVELVRVQPEGKAPMSAADWANGARPLGERFGS